LKDILKLYSEILVNHVPISDALSVAHDMGTLGYTEHEKDLKREFIISRLLESCSKCIKCPRNASRILPVFGDGPIGASVFLVVESPTWIDNRTGIPLTSRIELKSSRCSDCSNTSECYKSSTPPSMGCSFNKTQDPKQNLNNKSWPLIPSTTTINQILLDLGFSRESWSMYVDKRKDAGLESNNSNPPNIYISSALKCYSPEEVTESDLNSCIAWLLAEKYLVGSEVCVFLGDSISQFIGLKKPKSEISEHIEPWGDVYSSSLDDRDHFKKTMTEALSRAELIKKSKQ
jgi:uracil-DNA glycosylase